VDDTAVAALARKLAAALDVRGWYMDLQTANETIVVFPGRVFRYHAATPKAGGRPRATRAGSGSPTRSSTGRLT
jgi:hypothetical protein